MDRSGLITLLERYESPFEEELAFVPRFLSLIRNFSNCFERALLTGHITASAWIIDQAGSTAVLVHHKKLDRWLQPGGHADGDENLIAVARKEGTEETGLQSLQLSSEEIFDLDIHLIPAHDDIQSHFHYDFRFAFTADPDEEFVLSDESNDLAWMTLDGIAAQADNHTSIVRMIRKTRSVFK